MRDLYWLSEEQLKLIQPYFPPSRGVPRVDDLRVVSGIIFVLKRGLQWRDRRPNTDLTRRCITVLYAGAAWVFLTKFLRLWPHKKARPINCKLMRHTSKPTTQRLRFLKRGCFPRYRTYKRRPEF